MAIFAKIENSEATNMVVAEQSHINTLSGTWVEVTPSDDGVGIGWKWDGEKWSEPDEAPERPEVPTAQRLEDQAHALAIKISQRKKTAKELKADSFSDQEISQIAPLFPAWSPDAVDYAVDDVLRYADGLYPVTKAHTSQPSRRPDTDTTHFGTYQSARAKAAWAAPSGTDAGYRRGQRVTQGSKTWMSQIDENRFEPGTDDGEQYWEEIDEADEADDDTNTPDSSE